MPFFWTKGANSPDDIPWSRLRADSVMLSHVAIVWALLMPVQITPAPAAAARRKITIHAKSPSKKQHPGRPNMKCFSADDANAHR